MPHFTPSQRRRIRRATQPPEHDPVDDELNIVPFLDIVVNLIMFLLLTMTAALAAHEVHAQLPTHGPTGQRSYQPTVAIGDEGIWVSDGAGHYGAGCTVREAAGPTIPIVGGEPDWLALRACVEVLHRAHPEARTATLTAEPRVPVQWIISAMDAVKGPRESLFADVQIAAGVR